MRGTLELRRRFRGIGELRIASGTRDPKLRDKMDAMLLTLADAGRYDVLRSLHERRLAPMDVWDRYKSGDLKRLPSADALKRLAPAWARWVKDFKVTDGHRRDVTMYGKRLIPLAGKSATVRDLPKALRTYRKRCEAEDKPVTFNRARAAAQAFLRDTVTANDDTYREVQAIETLTPGKRDVAGGQTPAAAVDLAKKLPREAAVFWLVMCLSGMGPGEVAGRWNEEGDAGLRIKGTKRESRDRVVPRLFKLMPRPRVAAVTLRKHLLKTETGITPYDGRRTFAHWMETAHIARTRRKLYMGHKAGDVTDLYEQHDVTAFLTTDRDSLSGVARPAVNYLTELLTDGDTVGTGVSR